MIKKLIFFILAVFQSSQAECLPNYWPCEIQKIENAYEVSCVKSKSYAENSRAVQLAFLRNEPNPNIGSLFIEEFDCMADDRVDSILSYIRSSDKTLKTLSLSKLEQLTTVPSAIEKFVNLENLLISGNKKLTELKKGTIKTNGKLNRLDLSSSSITWIDNGAFEGDFSRTRINLSENKLRYFDWFIFQDILESMKTSGSLSINIKVQQNPIKCNCALKWLISDNRNLLPFVDGTCIDENDEEISFEKFIPSEECQSFFYDPCDGRTFETSDQLFINVKCDALKRPVNGREIYEIFLRNDLLKDSSNLMIKQLQISNVPDLTDEILENVLNFLPSDEIFGHLTVTNCSRLTRVPEAVSSKWTKKLYSLNMSGNNIPVLTAGSVIFDADDILAGNTQLIFENSNIGLIEPGAFKGHFHHNLILNQNKLTTLDHKVFKHILQDMIDESEKWGSHIELTGNPIVCDCSLFWLFSLSKNRDFRRNKPIDGECTTSENRTIDLNQLTLKDLGDECTPDYSPCQTILDYYFIVECSNTSFEAIQEAFYWNTPNAEISELHIEHSGISDDDLSSQFFQLFSGSLDTLKSIEFSNCGLTQFPKGLEILEGSLENVYLRDNDFKALTSGSLTLPFYVEYLDLTNSKISVIEQGFLVQSENLGSLILDKNLLKKMEEDVFLPFLKQGISFSIFNNPIRCNCSLAWLARDDVFDNYILHEKLAGNCRKGSESIMFLDFQEQEFLENC